MALQKKEGEKRRKAELEKMEALFENPLKPNLKKEAFLGPKDAPITLVEYSDFECPYCSRAAGILNEVNKKYEGKVKIVYKNQPLPFHKNAEAAGVAALAAGEQGKFWEFHDKLFANYRSLSEELYTKIATDLGLDLKKFEADRKSEKILNQMASDKKVAQENGISGTPAFFVNGVLIEGAYPVAYFSKVIDRHLKAGKN